MQIYTFLVNDYISDSLPQSINNTTESFDYLGKIQSPQALIRFLQHNISTSQVKIQSEKDKIQSKLSNISYRLNKIYPTINELEILVNQLDVKSKQTPPTSNQIYDLNNYSDADFEEALSFGTQSFKTQSNKKNDLTFDTKTGGPNAGDGFDFAQLKGFSQKLHNIENINTTIIGWSTNRLTTAQNQLQTLRDNIKNHVYDNLTESERNQIGALIGQLLSDIQTYRDDIATANIFNEKIAQSNLDIYMNQHEAENTINKNCYPVEIAHPSQLYRTHYVSKDSIEYINLLKKIIKDKGIIRQPLDYVIKDGKKAILDGNNRLKIINELRRRSNIPQEIKDNLSKVPVKKVDLPYNIIYQTIDDVHIYNDIDDL